MAINSNENTKFSPLKIAKNIDVPSPFLAKILQQLSKNAIISSTKGRNGGFYLTEENREATLIRIVEVIDGIENITACLIGLPNCSTSKPCPIHHIVAPLRNELLNELRTKSLNEIANEIKEGKAFIVQV